MLVLVAVMSRGMMPCGMVANYARLVDRMDCGSTISRDDHLCASHMHRRLAGNFGAETKPAAAVMAFFVGHRAHRVALGVIAGSAARSPGHSGRRNNDDAHGFILAICSKETRSNPTSRPFSN
jgi:hypothetical protein